MTSEYKYFSTQTDIHYFDNNIILIINKMNPETNCLSSY